MSELSHAISQPRQHAWGWSYRLADRGDNQASAFRLAECVSGQSSWHKHTKLHNAFCPLSGAYCVEYRLEYGTCERLVRGGDRFVVRAGTWHRFTTLSPGLLLEEYWAAVEDINIPLPEDDIVREDTGRGPFAHPLEQADGVH